MKPTGPPHYLVFRIVICSTLLAVVAIGIWVALYGLGVTGLIDLVQPPGM